MPSRYHPGMRFLVFLSAWSVAVVICGCERDTASVGPSAAPPATKPAPGQSFSTGDTLAAMREAGISAEPTTRPGTYRIAPDSQPYRPLVIQGN